jgi:hypothetical protein
MAGLTVHTEPASEPLSQSETKSYLRVTDSGDDALITSLIVTARKIAEEHMSRAIISQTLQLFIDTLEDYDDPLWEGMRTGAYLNYYKNYIDLPFPEVTSISHIKTYDDADNATTFANTKYFLDNARQPARVVLRTGETFPTALRVANAIEVKYVTGYTNANSVPAPIKIALLQIIAFLYEHRGDMYEGKSALPPTARKLLDPYVVFSGLGSSKLLQIG